jgi:hypothetical protein
MRHGVMTTDASHFGWGVSWKLSGHPVRKLAGPTPLELLGKHSTLLEMHAVRKGLEVFGPQFMTYLLEVHRRTSSGRTVAMARAAIEAIAIESRWDPAPFRADIVHKFVRGAVKSKPSEPKPPVTFDAAELLRRLAQRPLVESEKFARAALLAM